MMKKVLVVEDEAIGARDIRKTLERNGYKVVGVARTVEKAFALIKQLVLARGELSAEDNERLKEIAGLFGLEGGPARGHLREVGQKSHVKAS